MVYILNKIKKNIIAIFFISLASLSFIYLINSIYNSQKNKNMLRQLEENKGKEFNEICMAIKDHDLYDIKDLESNTYKIGEDIKLRFCKNIDKKSSCLYRDTIRLAGSIYGEEGNYNKFNVKDDGTINIILAKGDKNKIRNENYLVNITLKCDKNLNDLKYTYSPINFNIYNDYILNIEGSCKQACVIKDRYVDFGLPLRIIFVIILLIFGFIIGFFGFKCIKITIYFVSFAGLAFVTYIILNLCDETNLVIMFVVMGVFGLAGIGISIFFMYKKKYLQFYAIFVGVIMGFLIGSLISELALSFIETEHLKIIEIIVIIILVAIGVIFGICFNKETIIVGTSIIGSYCLIRGLSLTLYQVLPFVNELKIYDLATHHNYEQLKEMIVGLFLIYPSILVVLIIVTIIIQCKFSPNLEEKKVNKTVSKIVEESFPDSQSTSLINKGG